MANACRLAVLQKGSPGFNAPEAEEGQKVTVQEGATGMGCSSTSFVCVQVHD